MELIECQTCGSHSFTNGKCDYCGNQYEVEQEYQDLYDDDKHALRFYAAERESFFNNEHMASLEKDEELETILDSFEDKKGNETATKIMLIIFFSVIWFAVTVFIPPLFIITIILLVVFGIYRLTKRKK